ncbi:MAG: protein kinase [Deltaproteobacteria bacterium]|nr:protein kinase [Deltaproteobacteria bacterium]
MFPHEPPPERIGPYKILRHLSSRGSADLYLGEHVGPMGFQRSCVLKLVPAPSNDDIRSAQDLAHEARICSRLNHPAIVRMHDFFEHGDRLVLVFEHFAGLSLARLLAHLRRRRMEMSDTVAWYIAHQLFSALTHAHALCDDDGKHTPVIHRDVQPAHIIISSDAQVRLTGYGIAKIAGTVGDTAVGFIKGTPAYMAPEQARGEKVTERVDVYAAGLVVWEMLTGQSAVPPGQAKPGGELLRLISGRRVDPVSALRTDIPREIAAAIDACLEPAVEKRTIKCADVERWLKKVCDTNTGREQLQERLVQMRNVAVRPMGQTGPVRVGASPSKAADSVRAPSRFPGVATRVTGRVSVAAPGQSQAPPVSRRAPGVRGTRSTAAPPPSQAPADGSAEQLTASDVQDEKPSVGPRGRQATLLGVGPSTGEVASALKAPRVPDVSEPAKPAATRASPRYRSAERDPGRAKRTLLGVAPNNAVAAQAPVDAASTVNEVDSAAAMPMLAADDIVEDVIAPVAALEPRIRDPQENTKLSKVRRTRRWIVGGVVGALAVLALAAGGIALSHRTSTPQASAASAPVSTQTAAAPPASVPAPAASSSAQPVASAEASAAPSAEPPPTEISPLLASYDVLKIPPGMGAILVKSPPEGVVYVNGIMRGETDKVLTAPCGRRFLRVGTKIGPMGLKAVSWLSDGQSAVIPCRKTMQIDATPANPIRNIPKKQPKDKSLPWSIAPF